jgi:hypothetical protein
MKPQRRAKRDPVDAYIDFVAAMQHAALRRATETMRGRLRALLAGAILSPPEPTKRTAAPKKKKRCKDARDHRGGSS